MKVTPNYILPQIEGTDLFDREVLNDGFKKIDTALSDLQETVNNASGDGVIITQEVVEARGGEQSLKERLNKTDYKLEDSPTNINEYKKYVVNENWKNAFEMALLENDKIYVPKGTYKTSMITVPSNKTIYGDGDSTVFVPLGTTVFKMFGNVENEVAITEDMTDFSSIIKAPNSLRTNDFIMLRGVRDSLNETDSGEDWCLGYGTSADSLIFGEFLEVDSATSSEIIVKNTTVFPYYFKNGVSSDISTGKRANTTIQKVNFAKNVTIENLKIVGVCNPAINVDYGYNIQVRNVTNIADGYTDGLCGLVTFKRSLECEAYGCSFRINHKINPADHYYVNVYRISSSQDCGFEKCRAYNTTQAFDVSYLTYAIPSINSTIRGCFSKNAQQTGMTTHQGTFISLIEGNNIVGSRQGIFCRTKNSVISNNTILNTFYNASASYGIGIGESNTTNCVISNNTVTNARSGIYVTDGSLAESYNKYVGLTIEGNTINNCVQGIVINKTLPYSKIPMHIDIINNRIYSTRVSLSPNLIGIFISQGTDTIRIEGNMISLFIATNLTYGVYMDYDVNNVVVVNNTLRKCRQGIYHRRVSTLANVSITETDNKYYGCETNDNLTASTIFRRSSNNIPYTVFNVVGGNGLVPVNNSIYVLNDGTLKFKDLNGVAKTITTV